MVKSELLQALSAKLPELQAGRGNGAQLPAETNGGWPGPGRAH